MGFNLVPAEFLVTGKLIGQYTLTGDHLQSSNYVPGVSGWSIFGNGNSEFSNGIYRGQLVVGTAGGPQVKVIPNAGLAVAFVNVLTGAAPGDVSSVTSLQEVVELPSGDPSETSPSIIGQVKITYTDGDIALATLMLGALQGATRSSTFTMWLSASNNGNKPGGTLTGSYSITSGKATLQPLQVVNTNDGRLNIYLNGIRMIAQAGTNLIPVEEGWRVVGSAGNPAFGTGWSNFGHGGASLSFKLLAAPDLAVWINGIVTPASGAGTTLFTLPSSPFSYVPLDTQAITAIDITSGAAGVWTINGAASSTPGAVVAADFGGLTAGHEYVIDGLYSLDV